MHCPNLKQQLRYTLLATRKAGEGNVIIAADCEKSWRGVKAKMPRNPVCKHRTRLIRPGQ